MEDKVEEINEILYQFSNYWRHEPDPIKDLPKLNPDEAAQAINQLVLEARIDELKKIVNPNTHLNDSGKLLNIAERLAALKKEQK